VPTEPSQFPYFVNYFLTFRSRCKFRKTTSYTVRLPRALSGQPVTRLRSDIGAFRAISLHPPDWCECAVF
jgi:hypothetical protein